MAALHERRCDIGMLRPFIARFESVRCRDCAVDVRVLRGEVYAADKRVPLSRSELAVLIALAQQPRAFSICELGDLLFPELDADSASNRLYVYIHRLRQRLGREAIPGDRTGYRLGNAVDVDLWRLDRIAAKARSGERPSETELAALEREPLCVAEFDALALRLRLPETLAIRLRVGRSQQRALQIAHALPVERDAPASGW